MRPANEREPRANEVLLDEADGLDLTTLCRCDLLFTLEKAKLGRRRGIVTPARRNEIARQSSKDWPSPVCSPLPCSGRMKGPNPVESAIIPRAGVEEHLGGTVGSEHRPTTQVGRCLHSQESAQRAGDFEAEPGRWSGRHHSGPLPTSPDSGFSPGWCFRSNTSKLPSSVLVIKACPFAIP